MCTFVLVANYVLVIQWFVAVRAGFIDQSYTVKTVSSLLCITYIIFSNSKLKLNLTHESTLYFTPVNVCTGTQQTVLLISPDSLWHVKSWLVANVFQAIHG